MKKDIKEYGIIYINSMSNYTKATAIESKYTSNSCSSEIYNLLEKEVNQLESIENWNDRVIKMKEIREQILEEQQKLGELVSMVLKNDLPNQTETKKKKKQNLDNLVVSFKDASTLEEKIKLFHTINSHINDIESQLFKIQ